MWLTCEKLSTFNVYNLSLEIPTHRWDTENRVVVAKGAVLERDGVGGWGWQR